MDATVITDALADYSAAVPTVAAAGIAIGALTFGIRFLWRFGKSLVGR